MRPVGRSEEQRYQDLMQEHHSLGRLPKISERLWYVAPWRAPRRGRWFTSRISFLSLVRPGSRRRIGTGRFGPDDASGRAGWPPGRHVFAGCCFRYAGGFPARFEDRMASAPSGADAQSIPGDTSFSSGLFIRWIDTGTGVGALLPACVEHTTRMRPAGFEHAGSKPRVMSNLPIIKIGWDRTAVPFPPWFRWRSGWLEICAA